MSPAPRRRWPNCPECLTLMDPLRHAGVTVDRCRNCAGIWLMGGQLQRILRRGDRARTAEWLRPNERRDDAGMLRCPDCEATLVACDIAFTDVEVARCEQCDGIWLDEAALARLEVIRDGEAARADIERETTHQDWMFEFVSGLPIEFNMRPRRTPVVTWTLVGVCVVAFLVEFFVGAELHSPNEDLALGPFALVAADWPTLRWWFGLTTHAFLHGGVVHLAGNMFFLHLLGDNIEDVLGRGRFVAFFFVCAAFGGLAQTLVDTSSEAPMVGASGAIAGLAAAYTVLFRRAYMTMMVFFSQFKVSVLWYWGLWVAFNVFGASIGAAGIGWFAHLGGFVAGLAIALLAYRRVVAANPVLGYLNEGAEASRKEKRRPWRFRRRRRRVSSVARRSP